MLDPSPTVSDLAPATRARLWRYLRDSAFSGAYSSRGGRGGSRCERRGVGRGRGAGKAHDQRRGVVARRPHNDVLRCVH